MIINDLDLGAHSTWLLPLQTNQGPEYKQVINTILNDGTGQTAFARGRQATVRKETVYLIAATAIGGFAAGTQQAAQLLFQQLIELAANRSLQPCYVQFASGGGVITADPQDGWYLIQKVTPDNEFVWSGLVKVDIELVQVASMTKKDGIVSQSRVGMAFMGGALQNTNYRGTAKNWLTLPLNSVVGTLSRVGATGNIFLITQPTVNPVPIALSQTISDWWKGGCQVFDTNAASGINPVPTLTPGTFEAAVSTITAWETIGSGTTGTMNYWNNINSYSIASNVVTIPSTNYTLAVGGHADWTDLTFVYRFNWVTGAVPRVWLHYLSGNGWYIEMNGATIVVNTWISGASATVASVSATLTTGTWYWVVATCIGATTTIQIFADAGGTKTTTQVGSTATGTATDPLIQTGQVGIGQGTATSGFTLGGAFSGTCYVLAPVPFGWTPQIFAGEPAFALSRIAPQEGLYSASIYSPSTSGSGQWYFQNPAPAGQSYVLSSYMKTVGVGGTGASIGWQQTPSYGGGGAVSSNVTGTTGWTQYTLGAAQLAQGQTGHQIELRLVGSGTAYFDSVTMINTSAINFQWVEVKDTDHYFKGDVVLTNGLILIVFAVGQPGILYYVWTNGGWVFVGYVYYQDNNLAFGTLRDISLVRVGLEWVTVDYTTSTLTQTTSMRLRLPRGAYFFMLDKTPKSQSNSNVNGLFLLIYGGNKLLYTSGSVVDQSITADLGGRPPTSDYGYTAAIGSSSTFPYISGWLYETQPTYQPYVNTPWGTGTLGGTVGAIGFGDTSGPLQNVARTYGVFAVPFATSTNLQAEAETGTFTGSAVTKFFSFPDTLASAGAAAKVNSLTPSPTTDPSSAPTLAAANPRRFQDIESFLLPGSYTCGYTYNDTSQETKISATASVSITDQTAPTLTGLTATTGGSLPAGNYTVGITIRTSVFGGTRHPESTLGGTQTVLSVPASGKITCPSITGLDTNVADLRYYITSNTGGAANGFTVGTAVDSSGTSTATAITAAGNGSGAPGTNTCHRVINLTCNVPQGVPYVSMYFTVVPASMTTGRSGVEDFNTTNPWAFTSGASSLTVKFYANGNGNSAPGTNTISGTSAVFGPAWQPDAGRYNMFVRMKVTTKNSAVNQMEVGIYRPDTSATLLQKFFAPNDLTTSYAWYKVGTILPPVSVNIKMYAQNIGFSNQGTTTDIFIDAAVLVPITAASGNFPQDIWQQFAYDRTTKLSLP